MMQQFELHELVQVMDDNVIVVEFADVKSKNLFTNALWFRILHPAVQQNHTQHSIGTLDRKI